MPLLRRALIWVALLSVAAHAYIPGHFYANGHTQEKVIALTFDDGPGPITPEVLKLLKDNGIRATFFMEGTQIEDHSAMVRAVAAEGHEIGNHTYIHFDYHKLKNASPERLLHELAQTESSLRRALRNPEFKTRVVRMPYGYMNHTWLLPALKKEGYALVHWSFGKEGVRDLSPAEMAEAYIRHARPGDIFLFHDGGRHREKTLEALKLVVDDLQKKGYRFVAAEDLLSETKR